MTFSIFYFASGKGERMRPLTNSIPKPLLPVIGDLSILDLNLLSLREGPIKDVFISYSYRKDLYDKLVDKYKNDFRITLIEDYPVMGHGGVLLSHKDLFKSDYLIGFNADTLVDFDIQKCLEDWEVDIAMGILGNPSIIDFPNTVICDQHNGVIGIKTPNREYFYNNLKSPVMKKYVNNLGCFLISVNDISKILYPGGFMGFFGEADLIEEFLKCDLRVTSLKCSTIRGIYSMNTMEEYKELRHKLKEYKLTWL